ncbi:MAG TPA: F0F1 ATP synthase subunit A [Cytophagales bacterium]|nr:F0F1 ATP synthase subunit A [Cytophagales bacterium]
MSSRSLSASSFIKSLIYSIIFSFSIVFPTFSKEKEEGEKFNPAEMIVHHIGDAYDWHLVTIGGHHYSIPLPIILYSSDRGIEVFSSGKLQAHGEHESGEYNGYKLDDHGHLSSTEGRKFYDFSITKNAASMMLGGLIICIIFLSVASGFKKNSGKAPRGLQSFMEPLILYIRDDVAVPNIGEKKADKFLPYLLTLFFFIWINNLLGLIPTGANASGNIAFTFVLALLTAIIVNFSGNRHYWGHIFWTPGVPLWLRPIMLPVELIGIFTKPFALMIRLFANMTAGHIVILSLFSFIFIFESFLVGIPAGAFVIAMTFMELFVGLLQAYIFTILAALFIGIAVEEHHEEGHAHAEKH